MKVSNTNPIIIIDDDPEDLELMQLAFKELKIENEVIIFNDGIRFLEYIKAKATKTFFILCDINMSILNGLELKEMIYNDEELRLRCVPFVFLSTSKATDAILKAYSYGAQGYFTKPSTFSEVKEMVSAIVNYWKHSEHPNL